MNISRLFCTFFGFLCLIHLTNFAQCALPFGAGVFPLLTSGWYYKPSPVESVIFGVMVVKVLAIRLASITGILPIPYHLNDLFVRSLGKRSLREYQGSANLTIPIKPIKHGNYSGSGLLYFNNDTAINPNELKTMYRLLLGVRRLDTSTCFLKMLCFLGYVYVVSPENISSGDREIFETISYLASVEEVTRSKASVMDIFQKAIAFGKESKFNSSCDAKYIMCNLSEDDVSFESIISDLS